MIKKISVFQKIAFVEEVWKKRLLKVFLGHFLNGAHCLLSNSVFNAGTAAKFKNRGLSRFARKLFVEVR